MIEKTAVRRFLLCSGCYLAACFVYTPAAGDFLAMGQALNIVLAALPLCFAAGMAKCTGKAARSALCILWLLFLPNSFYLLTDLVHMPVLEWKNAEGTLQYVHDTAGWALTMLFGVGAALGAFMGLCSMRICRKVLLKGRSNGTAAVCGGTVILLCGFGVYIGRFLRLNSWDVRHPVMLAKKILSGLDGFAVQMTLIFALAILILWICYSAAAAQTDGK